MRSSIGAAACGALLVSVLGAGPAAAESRPAADCRNVAGHLTAVAVPQFSGGALAGFHVVVTSATGDLAGAVVTADLSVTRANAGGSLQLDGEHRFDHAASGLHIKTDDFVRVSPGGVVNDTLRVVTGGSGVLHTHGTVDLATGAVSLDYWGRVCD